MRRALLVAAACLAALHAAPSTAEPAAQCRQTAGPNGVPGNPSIGGVCRVAIPVAETGAFTIRLTPSAGFTGVLTAKVTSPGYGGIAVTGVYAGGQLVHGMDEALYTLVAAQDAVWTLTVSAGDTTTTSTSLFPPLPQQAVVPGVAMGEFGAEVFPAAPQQG